MQQRRTTEPFERMPMPNELREAVATNTDYRRVLYTNYGDANGRGAGQLVAMALGYHSDDKNRALGWEVHPDTAQYFAVESGEGMVWVGTRADDPQVRSQTVNAQAQSKWEAPPGTWHDVTVDANGRIQLLTIYHPPHHPPGTVDRTRADAERREAAAAAVPVGAPRASAPLCDICGQRKATARGDVTGNLYCATCGVGHLAQQ